MPLVLRLRKPNAPTFLAGFVGQPTWEDLASTITKLYNIPSDRVGVAFIDEAKGAVILTNEQELQRFYTSLDQSSEEIKFIVQDMNIRDADTTIASTWSTGSNLSMSDDKFRLLCWVLNKPEPFSVDIGKNETVDDLKKAIKNEMEDAFAGIDDATLNLWKLSTPIHCDELDEKLNHARKPEEIAGCIKLYPNDNLSEHFSSPPRRHVHIIVQLPLHLIQSTGPNEDTQVRQLRLLCERYWKRGEKGRAEIYKNGTVQVPFMARPGAKGAEGAATTSEGMSTDAEGLATGAQEAISVASKTMSGDRSEGSNEGLDEESDLDFDNGITDRAVSYESLPLGPDFNSFFGKGYSSILVRKEYRDMFQHISNLHNNRERGVVVTGMPGIGKSIFLFFLLVERILNGQSTAYQCDPTRVILMLDRHDVRIFPANVYLDPQGFPGTWALVDSNDQLVQPRGEFTGIHSEFYLVQATSPQPVRWNAWKKQLSASVAVMKPWSWEELYIGGTEFITPSLEPLTLRNVFVKYGRSAHLCYILAKSRAKVTGWEKLIPNLLTGMPDISIFEGRIFGNTLHPTAESIINASSELITIIPDPNRQPCVNLVSRHVAEHFFRAVLVYNHKSFWNYFNRFSSESESRTPAGWLWELYAILVELSTQSIPISLCHLSPIKPSQPPKKKIRVTPDTIELPFSDVIVHGDQEALGEELSRAIPSLSRTKSTLFIPGDRDQVTFDGFSISGDNLVTLYQATIRGSHSIKAKGLDFVWDALKLAMDQGTSDAKRLLPSSNKKWRIVFLIPREIEKHWKTAQDIDFGGIEPKRQWGRYVEQFVGVLPKRHFSSKMAHLIPPPLST